MKKQYIHLLCWAGLYIFWVMIFQRRTLAFTQTATVQFCYLLFISANYYFNTQINIPRFLHAKKYRSFALLYIAGIAVTALARAPLAMILNKNVFNSSGRLPGFSTLFTDSMLNIGIWLTCIIAAKLIIDRSRLQQYVDQVNKQKEQAELDFLNAQFNPHFLFNSINSIYGQIDKRNTDARSMLLTFSDMLRYQLYECNESLISIDKELDYIRNYVSLQKVRKNDLLKVSVEIADDVKGFRISPLLFIAFIENSFKYAGGGDDDGEFVCISFTRGNGSLHFTCKNSKGAISVNTEGHNGIGISNAKRRLGLLYPSRHSLAINDEGGTFEVNLKIDIDETELHYS